MSEIARIRVGTSKYFFSQNVLSLITPILLGQGSVELKVTFCPTEYITASGAFDLVIEQYDNPVYRCTVMGLSQPGEFYCLS